MASMMTSCYGRLFGAACFIARSEPIKNMNDALVKSGNLIVERNGFVESCKRTKKEKHRQTCFEWGQLIYRTAVSNFKVLTRFFIYPPMNIPMNLNINHEYI